MAHFHSETFTDTCFYLQNVVLQNIFAYPTMLSVQCTKFSTHSQLACKRTRAGLPLSIHRTRPAPWRRQSRGFDTPFSMRLLSPRVKYPLLIFLAFACNELHVSFPQGKGMQRTGVAGIPTVAGLGQTRCWQQLLAHRDPGSSCTMQSSLLEQGPGLLSTGPEAQRVPGTSQPLPCKAGSHAPWQLLSSAHPSPSPMAQHGGVLHSCTFLVVFFSPFTSHKAASSFPRYGSSRHPWFSVFAA